MAVAGPVGAGKVFIAYIRSVLSYCTHTHAEHSAPVSTGRAAGDRGNSHCLWYSLLHLSRAMDLLWHPQRKYSLWLTLPS